MNTVRKIMCSLTALRLLIAIRTGEALRDNDMMVNTANAGEIEDPFLLTTSRLLERHYMKVHGILDLARDQHGNPVRSSNLRPAIDNSRETVLGGINPQKATHKSHDRRGF